MKPIPGADDHGETVNDRIAALIARVHQQRAETAAARRQMAIRRAYGLRRRHTAKERHQQENAMTTTAPRHTDHQLDAVRTANPTVAVIAETVTLTAGDGPNRYAGACPHCDGTRTLRVDGHTGYWDCTCCGLGGDVFAWVCVLHDLDTAAGIRHLAERAGIDLS